MVRSFLQSTEWLQFQESIGHKTWRFDDGKIRANIVQHKIPLGKNYLYIPHGPEIFFDNIQSGLKNEVDNFLRYLKDLAKENKSIFVKFEPLTDVVVELIFRKGVKKSKKYIQPMKTVIINLDLSEDELLSHMHHKTRYNINLAQKKDLQLEESTDVDIFWKLLQKTAKKDRFNTHTKDYYEKLLRTFDGDGKLKSTMFLVLHGGKSIAGAITLTYGDTVYYLHGAMNRDYKELMAPYFMHWEIIKFFKANSQQPTVNSYKYYDLWGIDSQRWPGVTRFKLSWLGSPKHGEGAGWLKEYPGSFDLVVSRFWYFVYKIKQKLF
ncbi:MAG: peptidoglycan bridge formation glycyltransferase FemA/FemB family protein [Patescibacteria group bacterium]